jgi:exodeoxyribonuclease VII large subunit
MTGPGVYTPAALVDLMERRLQEIASQVTAGGRLIGVTGQLVEIPEPRRNGIIYDAKLADPVSTEFVLLEMRPSTLLEVDAQEGDTITAYGPVVANLYKGRATLRLQVDRIELAEPAEERELRAAQLPLLETVRQVGATRNAFPTSPTPSIALLRSGSSAVRDDFLGTLGELRTTLPIREVEVSMASPADVAAQIEGCMEDVLVLIRGGGDASDFAVFEAPVVLRALGRCRSFRLLGLGHSQHRTLADCIADHAAAVPAEAGRFLRERVLEVRQNLLEAQAFSDLRRRIAAQWSWRATFALMALVFLAGVVFTLIAIRSLR